jgi:5-carboxymethyl-2-hydroxymuconate isomerase
MMFCELRTACDPDAGEIVPMPHLIIEYSVNLDADLAMRSVAAGLHAAALETGIFPIGGCRTRLSPRADYIIGDGHPDNRFIHVQARIGTGRPPPMRQRAADHIFARLKAETDAVFATKPLGLTLEVVEIDPVGSLKHNNLHDIIAARQAAGVQS